MRDVYRLAGKPLNQELELTIINLDPKKYWEKGAGVTNARIRELIDLHEPPEKKQDVSTVVNKPMPYGKSDFVEVIKHLEHYKSADIWQQGDNQEPINISEQELEIIKHSLAIASTASEIPNWSSWMVTQLRGVLAVMEAFTPIIKKLTGPLPKLWNGALKKLQKALAGMEMEEAKKPKTNNADQNE